jgi:hypothetical protein
MRERAHLGAWLTTTFDPAAVRWDEQPADRHGQTYGRARTGYGQYQQQTATLTLAAAYKELHLLPSAPAWAAEAVYRAAVRVHHPDAGGDSDGQAMVRLNLAMEMIRRAQQDERKAS